MGLKSAKYRPEYSDFGVLKSAKIVQELPGASSDELADLRADFGIFADTKHRELPGASPSFTYLGKA